MKSKAFPKAVCGLTAALTVANFAATSSRPARADDPKIAGPNSFLRVLHAVPLGPKVDVFIDGTKRLNDVEFGSISKYLRLSSGYHSFRITSNNPSRTLFAGSRSLQRGDFYVLSAYGSPFRPRLVLSNESQGRMAYGRARLTAYHLAPGAAPVDVVAYTSTGRAIRIFSRLRFGQSRAAFVPAVPMTIQVRSNGRILKTITGVTPHAGRRYAAFAIGRVFQEPDTFIVLLDVSASQ